MDEIERELKQVQLQRERLALERELARISALEWFGKGVHAATRVATGIARRILVVLRFFARQWKLILLSIIVIASAMGAMAWQERLQQERYEAEKAAYEAEQAAFVSKRCGRESELGDCSMPGIYVSACLEAHMNRQRCSWRASVEFARMRGR